MHISHESINHPRVRAYEQPSWTWKPWQAAEILVDGSENFESEAQNATQPIDTSFVYLPVTTKKANFLLRNRYFSSLPVWAPFMIAYSNTRLRFLEPRAMWIHLPPSSEMTSAGNGGAEASGERAIKCSSTSMRCLCGVVMA